MPFDPDQYLQKFGYDTGGSKASIPQAPKAIANPTAFNPDQYLAKAAGQAPQQEPSVDQPVTAALHGFGQAASLGYLPQLQAAAEPYTNKIFAALEGKQAPEDTSSYIERRDENIHRLERLAKGNPKSFVGGLLAGSVAGGAGLTRALPAAVTSLSPIKQAAVAGGIQGLLSNPGDAEGQIGGPQLEERAKGGLIGAAIGGTAEKALSAVQAAPVSLKKFAAEKAFKSSGAMLKDFRKAFARDRVEELGQTMIDTGLVKPGMTFHDVSEKSAKLKQDYGKQIGEVYDRIADVANKNPDAITSSFAIADPQTIAAELTAATRDPKVMPKLGAGKYREAMDQMINQVASSGQTHDVRYLNDVIGELDSKINWAKRTPEMSDLQQGLVAMRRSLRDKVNAIADRLGSADEALSQHLKTLNKQYGNLSEINRISSDRVGRESANRLLSPSDYGAAGIGALIGSQFGQTPEERLKHAVLGAGLGGVNKLGRLYGNPALVQGASKLGGALQKTGIQNVPVNPAIIGAGAASAVNNIRR